MINPVNISDLVILAAHLHRVPEVEEAPVKITLHVIKDAMQDFQLNKRRQKSFHFSQQILAKF